MFKKSQGFASMFLKEERELPRDAAARGVMKFGPKMHQSIKVGQYMDFYHSKTGDKIYGKVHQYDGKSIIMKDDDGKSHKFKVEVDRTGQSGN